MSAHWKGDHDCRNIDSKFEPARGRTSLTADTRSKVWMPFSISLHDGSASLTECPVNVKLSPKQAPYPRPNTVLEECVAVTSMLFCFGYTPSRHIKQSPFASLGVPLEICLIHTFMYVHLITCTPCRLISILPLVVLASAVELVLKQSQIAALVLAITVASAYLPLGKVCRLPARYSRLLCPHAIMHTAGVIDVIVC